MLGSGASASYEITSMFTKAGQKAQKLIVPGGDGLLRWERLEGKNVKVLWDEVQYEDGRPIDKPENIEYHIIFTEDNRVQMVTTCEMHTATNKDKASYIGTVFGLTELEVTLPKPIGLINVIAVIPGTRNSMLGLVPYDPTEILISKRENPGLGPFIFWGVAAVLLIAVFSAIYFYKKFKKVKQELQYEMSDVRNVASISSGAIEIGALSTKARPYTPLVAERE